MDIINWEKYDYSEFQMFCNALLTFEFGKNFTPNSAPGKDGGIDGAFIGNYDNANGEWRFQYKFYKVARANAVSLLKSKIKEEAQKLKQENHFILLTNIELLPQEQSAITQIFNNEINSLSKVCSCEIWDGTKIFTLYLQYPLLQLWLNEGFTTAQLQDYRVVFEKNLKANNFEPSTLNNFFISRTEDIQNLTLFLNSDQAMALISGEAGIGKTRLVLEFFKNIVDKLESWATLVLLNRNIDYGKIRKALSSKNNNYVILIDDAHTYSPEVIKDVKSIADGLKKKVKLILTARSLEAFNSLQLIKEYEQQDILKIKLKELTRGDTYAIFAYYLSNTHFPYLNDLVEISYGKPILIIAILNAIFNNMPIGNIRDQDFLKLYVNNYFNEYYDKVEISTGMSKFEIKRFLQNVVLIEPFNFFDNSVIEILSRIHQQPTIRISNALKTLQDYDFVDGRFVQSIKPDFYSDILLSEIDLNEVNGYLAEFINYLDNIIINLSSVDEVNKNQGSILDTILLFFINMLYSCVEMIQVDRILTTINKISYPKSDIAIKCIDIYIDCCNRKEHIVFKEIQENQQHRYYSSAFITTNMVIQILSNLLYSEKNYDFGSVSV